MKDCFENKMSFLTHGLRRFPFRPGFQASFCLLGPCCRPSIKGKVGGRVSRQRGISIIIVVFILAVVSMLALSMVRLSSTQHISSLYTWRSAQAYFAARSGLV